MSFDFQKVRMEHSGLTEALTFWLQLFRNFQMVRMEYSVFIVTKISPLLGFIAGYLYFATKILPLRGYHKITISSPSYTSLNLNLS
jgi:hypothetical protein